jgi:hypothetical protein
MSTFDYAAAVKILQDAWNEYHSLVPTYRRQLEIMRQLKAENSLCSKLVLDKIPETFLRNEQPRCKFLNLPDSATAINYLHNCTPRELERLLHEVETARQSAFYTRLVGWLKSAKPRIMAVRKPGVYHYSFSDEAKRKAILRKLTELLD